MPRVEAATVSGATYWNLRDVGGVEVAGGGRVRSGLLFRSGVQDGPPGAGPETIRRLGVRVVFDLRTQGERDVRPDRLPPGVRHVVLDLLRRAPGPGPAELMRRFADPVAIAAEMGGGRGVAFFEARYREFVGLPSAAAGLGRLLRALAHERHRPALVHCTTGKDRTGWAVAVLQLALGAPERAVMAGFLAGNDALVTAARADAARFAAAGGDPDLVLSLARVYPAYLETAFDEMARVYGSLGAYLEDGLRVDAATLAALREAFVEPG